VEKAKPSSIGSNPYELFNLKISPVRNRTSSVFINRIIVVVPLYTQVWWAYLCHFNFSHFNVPLPNELYTILHPFTSIYYIVYTCCFCCLEVTSTKKIPVVWWRLYHGIPVGGTFGFDSLDVFHHLVRGRKVFFLLALRLLARGVGSFFWGVTSITSVFLKGELDMRSKMNQNETSCFTVVDLIEKKQV